MSAPEKSTVVPFKLLIAVFLIVFELLDLKLYKEPDLKRTTIIEQLFSVQIVLSA